MVVFNTSKVPASELFIAWHVFSRVVATKLKAILIPILGMGDTMLYWPINIAFITN